MPAEHPPAESQSGRAGEVRACMRQPSAAALLCKLRPYTRLQLVLPPPPSLSVRSWDWELGPIGGVAISDHYLSSAARHRPAEPAAGSRLCLADGVGSQCRDCQSADPAVLPPLSK